jgi:hypothetical protein
MADERASTKIENKHTEGGVKREDPFAKLKPLAK